MAPATRSWIAAHAARLLSRVDHVGLLLAAWFLAQSWAPSLLPRSWLLQGVVSGVSVAVGYWVGVLLSKVVSWTWRRTRWKDWPAQDRREGLRIVARLVALGIVVWAGLRVIPQHEWTWERLGYEPDSFGHLYLGSAVVTLLVAAVLLALGWVLRWLWRRVTRLFTRLGASLMPVWVAGTLALLLVAWAVTSAFNTWVLERNLAAANAAFAAADRDLDGAPQQPDSSVRSGGPDSEIDWAATGDHGRSCNRWSTSSTVTWPRLRCSIRICPARLPSWPRRRQPVTPVANCWPP